MAPAPLEVRPFGSADEPAWDSYTLAHPRATVFHRLAWSRAVQEAYGHRPVHLTAWRGGRLEGVLPLFLVKSVFVGTALVSVPYATYGGIVADSPEAAEALLEAGRGLCRLTNAEYLEMRNRDATGIDLPEVGRYDTFRKALPDSPEKILPSLPRKTRAAARAGLKLLGEDSAAFGAEHLDAVYDLYAWTMRRLGSPNYRKALFESLASHYGQDCVCLVVRQGAEPVAGVISFVFRDEIVPYFSGSNEAGMVTNANNVLYLRLMEYAVGRGLRWFDFNRTRRDNRGPYDFKRHHGFEPDPLHYQICLHRAKRLPNLTPSNAKFALAGRVWRKLPLWLTRSAGGRITKWIP